jgi:ATP-binding protein involved in chromosome partitioning
MSINIEEVLKALSKVTHPAQNSDIVSLNMVSDIRFSGKEVSFTLTFQKADDPLTSSLIKGCRIAIASHFHNELQVGEVKIESLFKPQPKINTLEKVKNIIAVASGKGGVGKSTVASNLAVALAMAGYKVGLIDADVYGPSVPKMFDTENDQPLGRQENGIDIIIPVEKYGVKLLSVGYFVNKEDALVWRGPMATSALKQLIHQGDWGELDFLMLDLPPGTGDVHLTIVQEMAVTGAVIVSTPQEVALADVVKGINMFKGEKINVPVLGLVENMAWFTPAELPNNKYYIFGKEGCKNLAEKVNIPLLGQIPIVQSICEGGDNGTPAALNSESLVGMAFMKLAENVVAEINKRNKEMDPTKQVEVSKTRLNFKH